MITQITVLARETPAIAALQQQNDDQGRYIVRLEVENTTLRRENARLRAEMAPLRRRKPRWYETASASVTTALDWFADWSLGWYL